MIIDTILWLQAPSCQHSQLQSVSTAEVQHLRFSKEMHWMAISPSVLWKLCSGPPQCVCSTVSQRERGGQRMWEPDAYQSTTYINSLCCISSAQQLYHELRPANPNISDLDSYSIFIYTITEDSTHSMFSLVVYEIIQSHFKRTEKLLLQL